MELKSNCVEIILFYGRRGELVEKMAETCKCEQSLATEFINKYFHFLTKECTSECVSEKPAGTD